MSENDEVYSNEEVVVRQPTKSRKNGNLKKHLIAYSIVIIVAFSAGCAVVGFSMLSSENRPRKQLANTEYYLRSIISKFDIDVFNDTSEEITPYQYIYNSSASSFENASGIVSYVDEQSNLEYMKISFPPSASENSIQSIAFSINRKSELNVIIFADTREVYNAESMKNTISLEFLLFASEITLYVF